MKLNRRRAYQLRHDARSSASYHMRIGKECGSFEKEKVVVIPLVGWALEGVSRNTWLGVRLSLLPSRDRSAPPAVESSY